jgi:molybdenum cofactor synthesis domain-containing protein
MLQPEEARAIVLRHARALKPESIALELAGDRILAEDLVADVDLPPFDAATMDGYAVVHDDDTVARQVLGSGFAGDGALLTVTRGTAAKIMTGAPIPPGATTVVQIENTTLRDEQVVINQSIVRAGDNIRPIGADLRRGDLLVAAGSMLGPAEVGLLASLGHAQVRVGRRPTVAVISTGNELVAPDQTPGPGQIRDSNRFSLAVAARRAGADVLIERHIADDEQALRVGLREAISRCDAVLTSGGVSMGDRDLVKGLLGELAEVHFQRVFLKPGKPLNFATVGETLLFGLPGNPVSSLVAFILFVQPALRVMQSAPPEQCPSALVRTSHPIMPGDRIEYQRAVVALDRTGQLVAHNTGAQMSARLMSFVGANALLIVPPHDAEYPAGTQLEALLLAPPESPR